MREGGGVWALVTKSVGVHGRVGGLKTQSVTQQGGRACEKGKVRRKEGGEPWVEDVVLGISNVNCSEPRRCPAMAAAGRTGAGAAGGGAAAADCIVPSCVAPLRW